MTSSQEVIDRLIIAGKSPEERERRKSTSEPKIKADAVRRRGEYRCKTFLFMITYRPQHRAEHNTRIFPMNELEIRKPTMLLPPSIIITTPTNPKVMPIDLFRFILSCKKTVPRTKTNNGFVANNTEATPEEVY
ncbi:unnamed protein product [marine sediment metagenome]|uniref:Uncharacterized protein n=1 Tax=marine sediment metagenome TaxID=412755 RepID=X0VK90_9ZZZZ